MNTYFSGFFLTFIIIVGIGHSTRASNLQKESLSSITLSTLDLETTQKLLKEQMSKS